MSHLSSTLLLFVLPATAQAALPSEADLTALLQAGGLLDQMVWVEEHLPSVQDPAERAAWKRIFETMQVVSEELGTQALPQGWGQVLLVAAEPPSEDALRATVGAYLLGTTPQGRAPSLSDRYREGRLHVIHTVFDYYAIEPDIRAGTLGGVATVVREHSFDEVLVFDAQGQDLDRERLAATLGAEGKRWTGKRMRREEDSLRAELARVNAALAVSLGLDATTIAAVESGGPPLHWTETMPRCATWMPGAYPVFASPEFTRQIAASAQAVPGLGEVCRVVPRREGEAEGEGEPEP